MTHPSEKELFTVPSAIVTAGAVIGLAIFLGATNIGNSLSRTEASAPSAPVVANPTANPQPSADIKVPGLSSSDHYLGNPKAKVVIVEYSDLECPYCKQFDSVLKKIIDNYGDKVAWVYRHMPLPMHPKAGKEAEATECAAELGGNAAFWKYTTRLFEITPSNNGLDLAKLPEIASYIGLDAAKFKSCLDSGKYAKKVADQAAEGQAAGARGTPYGVLITPKGNQPIGGYMPYERVEAMVKEALTQK
jgi:protein-disulfide isomerase